MPSVPLPARRRSWPIHRYTHRVAISNSRLIDMTGDQVRFRWRDYRHHNKSKVMTLAADVSTPERRCIGGPE